MRVDILGPLAVWRGTEAVVLRSAHQRKALAVLVVNDRSVSPDELIDALWGETPPTTAVGTLQTHLSRLRTTLGGGAAVLVNDAIGYRLDRDQVAIDAARFAALVQEASLSRDLGDGAKESARLAEALALWRGPALVGFRYEPFAQSVIARLDDMRLLAVERRLELDLALGRHAEICGEIEVLLAEHPLHEDLHGLLMVALYRSGRQADALAVYRRLRVALVEELGVEPTPRLQSLERDILDHVPRLALTMPDAPSGSIVPPPSVEVLSSVERWAGSVEVSALDPRLECELLLARGLGLRRSGKELDARRTYAAAIRLASASASPTQLAAAALGLAGPPEDAVVGEALDEALIERAIGALSDRGSAVAMLRARLAVAVTDRGDIERGGAMADGAIALARDLRDPAALAYVLRARHRTWFDPAELDGRLALDAELVALGHELGDPDVLAWGHRWQAIDLLETGDLGAFESAIDELEAAAAQLHDAFQWWGVVVRRAGLALARGPAAKAESLVMEAFGLADQIHSTYTLGASMLTLWMLRWQQGRLDEVRDAIFDVETSFPDLAFMVPHLLWELGEDERAGHAYRRLAADGFERLLGRDATMASRLFALALLTDSAWRVRDVDRVEVLGALLGPLAGHWTVIHPGIAPLVPVDQLLGQIAAIAGDLARSEAHFTSALASCDANGARVLGVRTRIAYAEALHALGGPADRDSARRLIAEAAATASELDLQSELRRLRRVVPSGP